MLFKLSLKNMKKSMKDYAIYFFTLILGVSIFYIFNSMETQTVFLNVTSSTREIIQLMIGMLSGVSVFVSVILGFLIIYANQFLMKRRKKEFAIYMTLGMSKRKISQVLLIETLLIGTISLIIGLFLGIGLSQFMSVLVANLFEADLSEFTFVFSQDAMIKTLLYFGIMYLLVMVFNTISVGRCKLIDLLQASKKNEKVKLKNPILCTILFIISVGVLAYCYYQVTANAMSLNISSIGKLMIMGAVATFFLFWSLSGILLKILMSMKRLYYKNLNMFVLRQLASKVNTTVFSMTVISLMLFLTIGILSSALSLKNSMTANLKELAPIDFQASKEWDLYHIPAENQKLYVYTEEEKQDSLVPITETFEKLNIPESYFKDVVISNYYGTDEVTYEKTLGSKKEYVSQNFPAIRWNYRELVMPISEYNELAKLLGSPTYQLKDDEYIVVADFDQMIKIRDEILKDKPDLTFGGKTYHAKYDHTVEGFTEMSSNHINTGIYLVPDTAVNSSMKMEQIFSANYNADTKEEKYKIENAIQEPSEEGYEEGITTLTAISKISIYEASVGLGAMVTFIGLYLGIIFLISSAAILALKELSESSDNKERYMILRRIGTDEKMIRHALFLQIACFFLLPLTVAIIHSIFGIQFANIILATFGDEQLLPSIIMTAVFLVAIYGGYFMITYFCSKNIIKEK